MKKNSKKISKNQAQFPMTDEEREKALIELIASIIVRSVLEKLEKKKKE